MIRIMVYIVFCLMNKPRRAFKVVMLLSLMWLGGYASIWISKWVLASVITGSDIIGDAMVNARIRTVGSNTSEEGATTVSILLTVWLRPLLRQRFWTPVTITRREKRSLPQGHGLQKSLQRSVLQCRLHQQTSYTQSPPWIAEHCTKISAIKVYL